MAYDAPVADMAFTLQAVAGLPRLEGLPGFETYDPDLIGPVLEEAGKLARDVLAPLNQPGDAAGSVLTENGVKAAPGGVPFRFRYPRQTRNPTRARLPGRSSIPVERCGSATRCRR